MAGIYLDVAGKGEQLLVDALVKLRSIFASMTGKIRTAHSSNKKGVARQDEPGIGATLEVRNQQANAFRRVAGRMQDLNPGIAEIEDVLIM